MKKYLAGFALMLSLAILPTFASAAPADIDPSGQTSACPSLQNNLRYQSRDSFTNGEVSTLQDFLQSQGYLNSEPTGYFGLLTFQASKNFQSANGISPTGYVGPITRAKIASMSNCGVSVNAPVTTPTPTPIASQKPTIYFFTPLYGNVDSGQSNTLSWNVVNATRCVLQYGSSEENVALIGSKIVYPTQTTSYRLWCVNDPGTGKDGPSAERTTSIGVNSVNASATIDQNTLTTSSGMPTISGYAYNVTQPFGVSISNSGGKVWASGNLSVNNNRWSTTINQTLSAGTYQVQVYSNNVLVTTGTLTITSPAPTCSLTSNKSSYSLGETITYSWTSQNATYASFQQDTSGKDHLWLPGDKLSANGSQQVSASVIGNPPVTLIVGGVNNGTGSCTKVVNVVSNSLETVSFDQNTLKVMPGTAFTLSGGTSAKSGSFTVAIVGSNYTGSTDWNTVGNLLKGGSSYTAVSKTTYLYGSGWSASFGSIGSEGYYTILIYDGNYNLLGTATLWVTFKG